MSSRPLLADFVQRATHRNEDLAGSHGATDCLLLQRRAKWRLAGYTATRADGRWASRLLDWKPWFRSFPRRDVGRPVKRWDADTSALAGGDWAQIAQDITMWTLLGADFANGFQLVSTIWSRHQSRNRSAMAQQLSVTGYKATRLFIYDCRL